MRRVATTAMAILAAGLLYIGADSLLAGYGLLPGTGSLGGAGEMAGLIAGSIMVQAGFIITGLGLLCAVVAWLLAGCPRPQSSATQSRSGDRATATMR